MAFPLPEPWPPALVSGTQPLNPMEFGGLGTSISEGGAGANEIPQTSYDRLNDLTPQSIMIRWNDDNSDKWSNEHTLTIGLPADTEFLAQKFRLGMYVSRQWEIVSQGRFPICIVSIEENVELLR